MGKSISIFGLGYVGSVTAACLAHRGNRVIGVDVNLDKVEALDSGRSPILEPQLNELVAENNKACRLHATADPLAAVLQSEISFVCVGTPSQRNGKLDLSHLERVCQQIGEALARKDKFHLVALRSTVLPGTAENLVIPTLEKASGKLAGKDFAVCVNPEFMREGTGVADFLNPSVTIIGAADPAHSRILREVYEWLPGEICETSLGVAQMVKYVCNVWHAVKVAFGNEVGTLCKQLDVDAEAVMEIFCRDTRLNVSSAYLKPGFAFGGSCLPKDLRALTYCAKEQDLSLPLMESLLDSNQQHLERAVALVMSTGKKRIASLGLSFKAGTDDLRESPQVQLIKRLLGEGCQIRIWDDNVSLGRLLGSNRQYIEEVIPHIGSLLCPTLSEAIDGADIVLIGTRGIDNGTLKRHIRPEHIIIDLVNLQKSCRPNGSALYNGICW